MYIASAHKKGISSYQLAKDLGITQKSGWFMLHRLRASFRQKYNVAFQGEVESDETYLARKYRSDFKGLSQPEVDYIMKNKQTKNNKGAVLGLAERNTGKVKMFAFGENTTSNITNTIRENVIKKDSVLYTDESALYNNIGYEYKRESVFHGGKEWVRTTSYGERVHTNTVENFWSVMKRGVYMVSIIKYLISTCSVTAMNLVGAIITGRLQMLKDLLLP